MDRKPFLEEILEVVSAINSNMPESADFYSVEEKLDTLIKLQEEQLDVSKEVLKNLILLVDNVDRSTDYLSSIADK